MEIELDEKERLVLKLFLKHSEVCRRHLYPLFPKAVRSTRYQILRKLCDKDCINLHNHSAASYYTITELGQELLKEITST